MDSSTVQDLQSNATTTKKQSLLKKYSGVICLLVVFGIFYGLGRVMGMANMLNTMMKTAHDLLLNRISPH